MRSDTTANEIEGSITKTDINKLRLHWGEYDWDDSGGLISNNGPNMIYILFKITNLVTRIGVSNLKYEHEKSTLAKAGNNVKDLIDDIH